MNITVPQGQSVEITAVPASGWQFDRWTGDDGSAANPLVLGPTMNLSITPVFSQIVPTNDNVVTVNPTVGGTVTYRVIGSPPVPGQHTPVSNWVLEESANSYPFHTPEAIAAMRQHIFPSSWSPYQPAAGMPVDSNTIVTEPDPGGAPGSPTLLRVEIAPVYTVITGPVNYLPLQQGPPPNLLHPDGGGFGIEAGAANAPIPHNVRITDYSYYRDSGGYLPLNPIQHPIQFAEMQQRLGASGAGTAGGMEVRRDPSLSLENDVSRDRHCDIYDMTTETLYCFYKLRRVGNVWYAKNAVAWDMRAIPEQTRMPDQDSTNAAGMPVTPLHLKKWEIDSGVVQHALACTIRNTRRTQVRAPAVHGVQTNFGSTLPTYPFVGMGYRLRLKQSSYTAKIGLMNSPAEQVVAQCLLDYGLVVQDITGGADSFRILAEQEVGSLGLDMHNFDTDDFEVVFANGSNS